MRAGPWFMQGGDGLKKNSSRDGGAEFSWTPFWGARS